MTLHPKVTMLTQVNCEGKHLKVFKQKENVKKKESEKKKRKVFKTREKSIGVIFLSRKIHKNILTSVH